jgi:hypothetical protein
MRIFERDLKHPTQASQVRLVVYEQPGGYLVTEARSGITTVVRTLGWHALRELALAQAQARARELEQQRYAAVSPA